MKPTRGLPVIVKGITSNGSDEHPAIVTRPWSDRDTDFGPVLVNVTVFPDLSHLKVLGSIPLYSTREEAEAAQVEDPLHAPVAFVRPKD